MTRGWHGLRPKALLLFALQSLVGLGITLLRRSVMRRTSTGAAESCRTGGSSYDYMAEGIRRPSGWQMACSICRGNLFLGKCPHSSPTNGDLVGGGGWEGVG